jgi:hypothetical protein
MKYGAEYSSRHGRHDAKDKRVQPRKVGRCFSRSGLVRTRVVLRNLLLCSESDNRLSRKVFTLSRSLVPRAWFAFVLGICYPILGAAELKVTVKSISAPVYDDSGHLIRWLKAEGGSGSDQNSSLKRGSLEFFTPAGGAVAVSRLDFDDAIFQRQRQQIAGDGHVIYRAPEGQIEGVGFRYEIPAAHLQLRSRVVLTTPNGSVSSQEGEAIMAQDKGKTVTGLVEARLKGSVLFTKAPGAKYDFDRAETASAVYTGADGILTLASPVTTWRGGEKSVLNAGEIQIVLGKLPNKTPGGAAAR